MVLMGDGETCPGRNGLTRYRNKYIILCWLFCVSVTILTSDLPFFQVGLRGESLSLHSLGGSSSVEWAEGAYVAQKQPLTWYKVTHLEFIFYKTKLLWTL